MTDSFVLPDGVFPIDSDPLDLAAPFWEGTREEEIRIQRCADCRHYQWGPELVCHSCHSFDLSFEQVAPRGTLFSWQRTWRPSHPALAASVPYVVVIVELDDAPGILLIGNLVGDATEPVEIGARLEAVFEHHDSYSLVQWRRLTA